MIAEWAKTYKH